MAVPTAVLLSLVAGSTVFLPGPAGAEAFTGVYRAKATASGVRVTYIVPKGSVSDTIADVGAPAPKRCSTRSGESRLCVVPLPAISRPTSGAPAGPGWHPAPDYPFYVSSFFPSGPASRPVSVRI